MKKIQMLLVALVVTVSLTACSGPSPSAPSPTADNPAPAMATVPNSATANPSPAVAPVANTSVPDACKLLTKDMAVSIVGPIAVGPKLVGPKDGMSSCTYIGEGYTSVLSLIIKGGISNSDFDQAFQASKGLSGVDAVKVDGLGDAAYWSGGTLGQMNVLKGGNWMILTATGAKGDLQPTLKDAFAKILAAM